jgi:NO-binding membrane sensor protein with MHYT domain/nitrogen-specific signal transduction histidine kinase
MPLVQHPFYVILAATVAVLGSWTALDLFLRVRVWVGQTRSAWLIAASVAMGLSIWAMHFIAMLGFQIGSAVRYDTSLTVMSLALAIGATGFAFSVASGRHAGLQLIAGAGVVMGVGICAMHYVGMAAIRSGSTFEYNPLWVTVSFVIAIGASVGALLAVGRSAREWRLAAAAGLGAAIVGMHYAAMAAVRLAPGPAVTPRGAIDSLTLAVAVASGTLFVLFLASVAALFDRRFEAIAAVEAKRSEEQLRAILDQMPVGIIVAQAPSGAVTYANPEAEHLAGGPVGETPPWLAQADLGLDASGQSTPPRKPEDFALYRAVKHGERTESERQSFRRPDGSTVVLEMTAAPIRDEDGRIILGVQAFHEVTAQIQAEEALRQSQRMEGIGQLTGGVAHDFNNVLTAILGSLTLAARRIEDERARHLIDNATLAARRGARLTEQLLAFSRRQRLDPRPLAVNAMIERMGGLFASTLGGTVKVISNLQDELPAAVADPAQLELALLNLALNARDAMPEGGELTLSTTVASAPRPLHPWEPDAGHYVCVTVADTGRGMSAETLGRAFEPFFTTKRAGKGSGLGLSQVLGLAKQLGGGVRVKTAPGAGCAVSICLPISREAPIPAPVEAVAAPPQAGVHGAAILLVDDDDDVRRFVADLLTEAGCKVRMECDGPAGLDALDAGPYDLVVLDFAMPGMTGAEVARVIRERRPDLPILIMTGYLEHEAVLAQLGAQPILQKPFEPSDLMSRIASTLRRQAEA